jgi:Leucine-rich repeat (LRR) protein
MKLILILYLIFNTAQCWLMVCQIGEFQVKKIVSGYKNSSILKKFDGNAYKNDVHVTSSDLKVIDEKQVEDVKQFLARGVNVAQFPKGLGLKFKNLKFVRFASCHMELMLKDDLIGFDKLEDLDLIGNKLEYLKSDVFEFTPNLKEIILNNNRLEYIGNLILEPLVKLEKISFGGNVCVASHATDSVELQRLKEEIAIKCSDITMIEVITQMRNLENMVSTLSKSLENMVSTMSNSFDKFNSLREIGKFC